MRRTLLFVLLFSATAPLVASAADEPCYRTSEPETDTGPSPAGRYYVDEDAGYDMWSIWVYEESNGLDGLQRDDEMRSDVGGCRDAGIPVEGDTVIF